MDIFFKVQLKIDLPFFFEALNSQNLTDAVWEACYQFLHEWQETPFSLCPLPIELKNAAISIQKRPNIVEDHCAANDGVLANLILGTIDLQMIDSDGETLLHRVANWGYTGLAAYLIAHGVNPALQNTMMGWTALHYAAGTENGLPTIHLLLANNPEIVNIADRSGNTALHRAVFCNKMEHAKILVAYGANVDAKNKYGKQPRDLLPALPASKPQHEHSKVIPQSSRDHAAPRPRP